MESFHLEKITDFKGYSIKYFGVAQNEGDAGSSLVLAKQDEKIVLHFMQSYGEQFSQSATLIQQGLYTLDLGNIHYSNNCLYEIKGSKWSTHLDDYLKESRKNLSAESKKIYTQRGVYDEFFRKKDESKHFFFPVNNKFIHVLAKSYQISSNSIHPNIFSKYLQQFEAKIL